MSRTGSVVHSPDIDVYGDVSYILGRQPCGDVGQLCSDTDGSGQDVNKINKKSLFKPIHTSFIGVLTQAQRKSLNYGYAIQSYLRPVAESNQGLIYAHLNNLSWAYVKPDGTDYTQCRITDFDGYDHDVNSLPFTLSYNDVPYVGNTSTKVEITFLDDFLGWGQWASYAPTYAGLYFGLLAWPKSNTNPLSCYFLPVTSSSQLSGMTILDIANNGSFTYPVTSTVFTVGTTYYLLPIITTYDAGNDVGQWRYIQQTTPSLSGYWYDVNTPLIEITPAAQPTPLDYVTFTADTESAVYSGDSPMTILSVPFYISNGNIDQLTNCSLYVYFIDYTYTLQGQTVELGHLNSFSINANTSDVLKTVTGNITITPLGEVAVGRATLAFTYNNQTYNKEIASFSLGDIH